MKVIAGIYGGRTIVSPKSKRTHPMSEKVRGGLFNSLGPIDGLSVLDVYSGSGALAIEAISRGAINVTAIDIDKTATQVIKDNVKDLSLINQIKVINAPMLMWSELNTDKTFDIVLADPPYNEIKLDQLKQLISHINTKGILVLSLPGSMEIPSFKYLSLLKDKNYGDSQLVFYRKIS